MKWGKNDNRITGWAAVVRWDHRLTADDTKDGLLAHPFHVTFFLPLSVRPPQAPERNRRCSGWERDGRALPWTQWGEKGPSRPWSFPPVSPILRAQALRKGFARFDWKKRGKKPQLRTTWIKETDRYENRILGTNCFQSNPLHPAEGRSRSKKNEE